MIGELDARVSVLEFPDCCLSRGVCARHSEVVVMEADAQNRMSVRRASASNAAWSFSSESLFLNKKKLKDSLLSFLKNESLFLNKKILLEFPDCCLSRGVCVRGTARWW